MDKIGDRLIYIRKKRGYNTQTELADAIGVTRGVIANIETNRYNTQEIVYRALCSTLNINREWLVNGTGPVEPDNERSKLLDELYQVCSELSEPQQRFILETIKAMQRNLSPAKEPVQEPEQSGPRKVDDIITNVEARKKANKFPGRGY